MQGQKEGASFLMPLGALMNELNENYLYHLMWAQAPARYQTIIDGLRAQQMEQAIDLDNSQRYATNLQNQMLKGFSALAALDQHELLMKNQQQIAASVVPVLEVVPKEPAPQKTDSGQK